MDQDIIYEKTRNGIPCIWETGRTSKHFGSSIIVANNNFLMKKAVYVPRRFNYKGQALIPINANDHIIKIFRKHNDISICVYKINNANPLKYSTIYFNILDTIMTNKVSNKPLGILTDNGLIAIEEAINKSKCIKCEHIHYAKLPNYTKRANTINYKSKFKY